MLNWLRSSIGKLTAVAELFEGRHFDREVIILCVRWYLRFKLSLRDLVEMMAAREAAVLSPTPSRFASRRALRGEQRRRRVADAGDGVRARSLPHQGQRDRARVTDTAQPRYGSSEAELADMARSIPFGRMAQPEEIARAAVFLVRPCT
jgi:NAD(P)-dependent dehydrogenase (short-subunit alcohol dehydrogenase family)